MRPSTTIRRLLLTLPAVLLLAALLAGCAAKPPVLAKVGDHSITTDDFLDFARASQGQYAGSPDTARAAALADLVRRELLVVAAEQLHLVPPAEQARLRRQLEDQLGTRALIQSLAPADPPVSDDELKELYAQRAREAHLWLVFTPDRASCEQALAALRRGEDFGAVADRFNMTGLTPPHGDLGFRAAGTLLPVLDQAVVEDSVGPVRGPLESPGDGWFLVRVTERRPRAQEPYDQVREALRQALVRNKQRALMNRAQKELKAQYHVALEPGAVQSLFHRYNAPRDTMLVGGQVPMPVAARPTPAETAQVLLRYDGENGKRVAYTLGMAMVDLDNSNTPRPVFSVMPMVEQWLQTMALQRIALIEARRRHLAEEPKVARQIREQLGDAQFQAAYEALVLPAAVASEADLRADYQRHLGDLARLQSARIRLATFADSAAAFRTAAAAGPAGDLVAAVRAAGGAGHVAETDVRYPTNDPLWARLQGPLGNMAPGQIGGPFRLGRGWALLQLVSKTQAADPFEKLDPNLRRALENDAMQGKRAARLAVVADSLGRVYPAVIHRERLARIPWPVPPEDAGH